MNGSAHLRVTVRDLTDPLIKEWWKKHAADGGLYTDTIFQTWEWHYHWWEIYGACNSSRRQYIVVIEDDEDIQSIAPFFVQRRILFGGTVWQNLLWFGTDHSEYTDLITCSHRPEIYWDAIVSHCFGDLQRARFELWDSLPDTSVNRYLLNRPPFVTQKRKGRAYQRIRLEGYEVNRFNASLARDVRACEEGLRRLGEIRWSFHDHSNPHLVQTLKGLNRQRFGAASVFSDSRMERLFDAVASDSDLKEQCFYAVLSLNTNPISILMGFHKRRSLYYYLSGFDPSAAKYSPTSLNIYRLLEYARNHSFAYFDFLRGDEPYKKRWGSVENKSEMVVIMEKRNAILFRFADVLRSRLARRTEDV